jgi:hypothetical protein
MELNMKMKRIFNHLALSLLSTIFTPSAMASSPMEYAVGIGGVGSFRGNNLENSFLQFSPELVGYGYTPLSPDFLLRPGIRANYAWQQPIMPSAIQIKEYDFKAGPELGIVWNGWVLPSFTLGIGAIYRSTVLQVQDPIRISQDDISGSALKPYVQVQVGLGIPISGAVVVVEPFGRYTKVLGDGRLNWATGIETTLSLF